MDTDAHVIYPTPKDVRRSLPSDIATEALFQQVWEADRGELWEGLPEDIVFEEAITSMGKRALRAQQPGVYIWVPPAAYQFMGFHKANKNVLFLAYVRRNGRLEVPWLSPRYSAEDVQLQLQTWNRELAWDIHNNIRRRK